MLNLNEQLRAMRKHVKNCDPQYSRKQAAEIRSFLIDLHNLLFDNYNIDAVTLDYYIGKLSVGLQAKDRRPRKYLWSWYIERMFDHWESTYADKNLEAEPGWRYYELEEPPLLLGGKLVIEGFSDELAEQLVKQLKEAL